MARTLRLPAGADELLDALAVSEQELWTRGGIEAQRRRRDMMSAALAAGCGLEAIANRLGVDAADIRAWAGAS